MQTRLSTTSLGSGPDTDLGREVRTRSVDAPHGFLASQRRLAGRFGTALQPLFPLPQKTSVPRRWVIAGYGLALPLLALVLLLRQSGVAAIHSMWAEDGSVFYQEALTHSVLWTLTSPYNGYMQLVTRLAVAFTGLFPVVHAALVISVIGAACVAGVALLVFHASRGLIPSTMGRIVLAASILLLPLATAELLNNTVNVPWWLFISCLWALLWRPTSTGGRLVAGVTCMLGAASDPATAIFLPLVAARILVLPRVREQAASIGLFAGLAFQLVIIARGASTAPSHPSTYDLLPLLSVRVWLGSLTGVQPTNWLIAHAWSISVLLGAIVVVCTGALVMVQRNKGVRILACFAVVLGALLFFSQVWLRGVAPGMAHVPVTAGSRYVAVPLLFLLSVFIAAMSQLGRSGSVRTAGIVVCCAILAPGWVLGFRVANPRSGGPDWNEQIVTATRMCAQTQEAVATVPIDPAGWIVDIPCSDLVATHPRR